MSIILTVFHYYIPLSNCIYEHAATVCHRSVMFDTIDHMYAAQIS